MSQQRQHAQYDDEELSHLYRQAMHTISSDDAHQLRDRGSVATNGSTIQPNGTHYEPQGLGTSLFTSTTLC